MQSVNPVIVAVDTEGPGHVTEYPTDVETVALQIPFAGGKIPQYKVLHGGVCETGKQWEGEERLDVGRPAQEVLNM